MTTDLTEPGLKFPFPVTPEFNVVTQIAPGILWVRFALPFRLDHINVYLFEEAGGYAVLDTGIGDKRTIAVWEQLLSGPLKGKRLTRLIVTHCHPDHVGAAGWMCKTFDLPLHMSQTEYLLCLNLCTDPGALEADHHRTFYASNGLDEETVQRVVTQGHGYLRLVTGLPQTFTRLISGETMRIGHRDFEVITGGGHSPEQVLLYCARDKLLFAADQVLAKISPNISVAAMDPDGDPLGIYLRSLRSLIRTIPNDVLVVPGHGIPFYGLHQRVHELIQHHKDRCGEIEAACRIAPRSAAEIVPVLFHRELDPHQMSFAFSEVLAHLNYMRREKQLAWSGESDGVKRLVAV